LESLSLNYKIVGQGMPVIILHGLFGMLDNWMNIAKKLEAKGYMALLIDQRDHGRSPHTLSFTYTDLANDLHQFMDTNWIHEAILIGHSMGGKTGLEFVKEYESMVSKLIIVDIGIKRYDGHHSEVFQALFDINIENLKSREDAYNIMSKRLLDEGTVQFLMKNLTRNKDGGYEWKMNLPLLYENYQNILASIDFTHSCDTKTLFVRGGRSNYIKDSDWPEISHVFPNARLTTIQNAGHWVHADQPIELFDAIIDFIEE
jgi:pimeloyl-ACP methyl ester carboxylesterase